MLNIRAMTVVLSLLSIVLATAGTAVGFSQQPLSGIEVALLLAVILPYALVLWLFFRRQPARAAALAFGSALVAFLSLALFAGVLTLFLGFAMGNKDQIYFALLLDAFVLLQFPLGAAAWRAWRGVPASDRPKGCWTVGILLPLAIAAGIAATYNGVKFGTEKRVATIQHNEQAAREAMEVTAACLKRYTERNGGYPANFQALGGTGDRCLDDALIAGELPSHHLQYSPGLPNAEGHIVLYGLCAEAMGFKKFAWRTYVADESGRMSHYEPREGMTRGATCGEAWGGAYGDTLAERVKYCVVDHAVRFPDKGYPANLDALGDSPGTTCLASSPLVNLRVEGGLIATSNTQQVRYRGGAPDGQGRITSFEIHGEQLLAGRWRVKVMLDDTGRWHAAEDREATRNDPAPEAFESTLTAREIEREAARAVNKQRCEAGEWRLCRELGGVSYDARHDGEAQALWQKGCEKGDGVSCLLTLNQANFRLFFLANSLRNDCLRGEAGTCEQLEKLGRDYLDCLHGDQAGCSWLAIRLGQRGETFDANKIWEKGCNLGHRESCYLLKARDFEYKRALQLKDLCDSGRSDACREFEQRMKNFFSTAP